MKDTGIIIKKFSATKQGRLIHLDFYASKFTLFINETKTWLNLDTGRKVELHECEVYPSDSVGRGGHCWAVSVDGVPVWVGSLTDIFLSPLDPSRYIYTALRRACRLLVGSTYNGVSAREFFSGFVPHRLFGATLVGKVAPSDMWIYRDTFLYPELAFNVVA